MKRAIKILTTALALAGVMFVSGHEAKAQDVSEANLYVSGNVPVIFSVTAHGLPGDLDLTPNVVVQDRSLGLLHFKYNANVATIAMEGADYAGNAVTEPSLNGGAGYDFDTTEFTVSVAAGCSTLTAGAVVLNGGADVSTAGAKALTTGVIEDCELTASWGGTTDKLPLAGKYEMVIKVIMTGT